MQDEIPYQLQQQRQQRHRRLMKMIKNYKKSQQDIINLQKIKNNTVLEINLRYLRSEHNRNYQFPKFHNREEESDLDQDQTKKNQQDNPFSMKNNVLYDLRTQNQIKQKKVYQNNRSFRVKSLEKQRIELYPQNRENRMGMGRIRQLGRRELSYKKLRKKSMVEQKRVYSTIKLPELKRQKIKTQNKNDSMEMQKIVGKKLATESSSPVKNQMIGKYLKRQQDRKSRKKLQMLKKN